MPRKPMQTGLDNNAAVRKKLTERLQRAINDERVPVAILHQMVQVLEMWTVDKE